MRALNDGRSVAQKEGATVSPNRAYQVPDKQTMVRPPGQSLGTAQTTSRVAVPQLAEDSHLADESALDINLNASSYSPGILNTYGAPAVRHENTTDFQDQSHTRDAPQSECLGAANEATGTAGKGSKNKACMKMQKMKGT